MVFHIVESSVLWGQRLDLGLKSWSSSSPSDFVKVLVVLRESSRCSPMCFDSIGVDSHRFIHSLEEVGPTLHCRVEFSLLVAIHLLHFSREGLEVFQTGISVSPQVLKPLYRIGHLCLSLCRVRWIVPCIEKVRGIFDFVGISVRE
jgi:hypothetical protein